MNDNTSTALETPRNALPEYLSQAVAAVMLQAQSGEMVTGIRAGPFKPAAEFLDIEAVRLRLAQLRIAQKQGGEALLGHANLVEQLRTLRPEQPLTYVILETATQQAKCYVDVESRQLIGVLWLPTVSGRVD